MEIEWTLAGNDDVLEVSCQLIPTSEKLSFGGNHEKFTDITDIWFKECSMEKIPQGLTKLFPNLKALYINEGNLKILTKNDLTEYMNLVTLHITYNDSLEFLPGDLFEDFKNLEEFSFMGNKLALIEPTILDGLDKLSQMDFGENPNYHIYYSDESDGSLDDVKNELYEKFFLSGQENVKIFIKKFQQNIQSLKKFNEILNRENQKLKKSEKVLKTELNDTKSKNSELTWKLEKGMFSDFKKFIDNGSYKDLQFSAGGGCYRAHKFLLMARSPFLAGALQYHDSSSYFELNDIPYQIFDIILKFMNTDDLPNDKWINFLDLFAGFSRLGMEILKNHAAMKACEQINAKNAVEAYKLSSEFGHDELRRKAFDEIKKMYPNINFKDEWETNMHKVLKIIEIEETMIKLEVEFDLLVK